MSDAVIVSGDSLSSLNQRLQAMCDEEPKDGLRFYVLDTALNYYNGAESFFYDVLRFGCVCGVIDDLVWYSDTHAFFNLYYDEIDDLWQEYNDSVCQPMMIKGDLKNTLAWFGFEETVYQIANELELDI